MIQDFPAAHSMDTQWFAVDTDGNIGIFNSSENGAVPSSNYKLQITAKMIDIDNWEMTSGINDLFLPWAKESNGVIKLPIPSEQILKGFGIDPQQIDSTINVTNDVNSRIISHLFTTISWINKSSISKLESIVKSYYWAFTSLLLIATGNESEILNVLKDLISENREYILIYSGEPSLIFLSHCSPDKLQNLFEQGYVRYALPLKNFNRNTAVLLGLFSYDQNFNAPCPYDCDGQPIYPLKLSDLPEKLQDVISWNWFDRIKFSESPKIQPIEHTRCDT